MVGGSGLTNGREQADEEQEHHSFGATVRSLRKAKGMTLQDFSLRVGKSIGYLSQVERDITKPSVKVLQEIADALDVDTGWFYPPGEDIDPKEARFVVRARNRRRISYSGLGYADYLGLNDYLLSPNLDGSMAIGLTRLEPGASTGDDPYTHEGEDAGYVLKGPVELTIDGETYTLEEGDSYTFPATLPHRFYNPTDGEVAFIWVITPIVFHY